VGNKENEKVMRDEIEHDEEMRKRYEKDKLTNTREAKRCERER
jgi:hypothetical protein